MDPLCFSKSLQVSEEPKDQSDAAATLHQKRQSFGPPSRGPGVRNEDVLSFGQRLAQVLWVMGYGMLWSPLHEHCMF